MKKVAFIFCLMLSFSAMAQNSDTIKSGASKTPYTVVYKSEPLIVLDGVAYKGEIKNIDPNEIHDITILKGNSATEAYGQDAIMGAVVIKTKKYASTLKVKKDTLEKVFTPPSKSTPL